MGIFANGEVREDSDFLTTEGSLSNEESGISIS